MKKVKIVIGIVLLACITSITGAVYASTQPVTPEKVDSNELQSTYAVVLDYGDTKEVLTVTYDRNTAEQMKEINSSVEGAECKVEKLDFAFNSSAMKKAKDIIE